MEVVPAALVDGSQCSGLQLVTAAKGIATLTFHSVSTLATPSNLHQCDQVAWLIKRQWTGKKSPVKCQSLQRSSF